MRELIRYELKKLFHRPIALTCLTAFAIFTVYILCLWVIPFNAAVWEENNGELVITKGLEAVRRNQEITALYQGPFTTQKAQSIIETYSFSTDLLIKEGLNPQRQTHYPHNYLYKVLSGFFAQPDGVYDGTTIEEIYGSDLASNLVLGYSQGWSAILSSLPDVFPLWACVLTIFLSPVFSDEYSKHTDALILTGSQGRTKCPATKIIAAYSISLGGSVILLGIFLLCLFFCYGFSGLECSAQLSSVLPLAHYPLTMGQALLLEIMLLFSGIIVYTALILVISALSKNSFVAVIISGAVLFLPGCIPPHNKLLYTLSSLLPMNQLKLIPLYFLPHPLPINLSDVELMLLSLPIVLVVILIGTPCARRLFSRHQVR